MERIFNILFIGLALLGGSLSQYESSGDELHEDEFPEESGDYQHQLTDCQKKRIAYKEKKLTYDPRCLLDGQFAPQQCSHDDCWCVDRQGIEIPATRGSHDCDAYADFTFDDAQEVKPLENDKLIFHRPGMLAGMPRTSMKLRAGELTNDECQKCHSTSSIEYLNCHSCTSSIADSEIKNRRSLRRSRTRLKINQHVMLFKV